MDERKRAFKKILKTLFYLALCCLFVISLYGAFVFFKTQTIDDPTKCFTTTMYKVKLCSSNSNYVRFKNVPKHFFQSLILSEDASFYSHKGFDWFEIKESFRRNFVEWKFARGGSTLTQQLAKNLYLTKSKSLDRKFQEFFIARQIEKRLSKSQILEKYVNVVEFGNNLFGLKKASDFYFSKSPAMLNILESIYLVSLLPSPKRLGNSFKNRKLSRNNIWRMKIILKRLYRTNKINDELFIYLQMLIEDSDWPFENYTEDMFQTPTIEDQMFDELDSTEDVDESFNDVNPSTELEDNLDTEDFNKGGHPTENEDTEFDDNSDTVEPSNDDESNEGLENQQSKEDPSDTNSSNLDENRSENEFRENELELQKDDAE